MWRLDGLTSNYTPPGALRLNIQSCHLRGQDIKLQTDVVTGARCCWLSRPECVRGCHGLAMNKLYESLEYLFSFAVVYVQCLVQQPRAEGLCGYVLLFYKMTV